MSFTPIEGFDASRGGPLTAAHIVDSGGRFIFRYAVSDPAPDGRGMTEPEAADLLGTDGDNVVNADLGLYWEAGEGWMLGGYGAGQRAAANAMANIVACKHIPEAMPVHYAHDIDPLDADMAVIESTVQGIADVVGWSRVGLYGGWNLIEHFKDWPIHYFVQTIAWIYANGWHPKATAHQYDTGTNMIHGVNCDLVRAVQPAYGQASRYLLPPAPAYPAPKLFAGYDRVNKHHTPSSVDYRGDRLFPDRARVTAKKPTYIYVEPSTKSPHAGPVIPAGTHVSVEWKGDIAGDDGKRWYMNGGGWMPASQYEPRLELPS